MGPDRSKRFLDAILALALLGLGISVYSFLHHQQFVSGSFCTLSATFNCDIVNRGPYSILFGIPVAAFGIAGYAFLAIAAFLKRRDPTDRILSVVLLAAAIGGLGFAAYLTTVEAFILRAWCLLCITSQLSILVVTGLAFRIWYDERSPSNL